MKKIDLDVINKDIYEDGKIYWREGYDYSSKLWEDLKKQGWFMIRTRIMVEIFDTVGSKVVSEFGRVHALRELANVLR